MMQPVVHEEVHKFPEFMSKKVKKNSMIDTNEESKDGPATSGKFKCKACNLGFANKKIYTKHCKSDPDHKIKSKEYTDLRNKQKM